MELDSLLKLMTDKRASDLHLKPTRPPKLTPDRGRGHNKHVRNVVALWPTMDVGVVTSDAVSLAVELSEQLSYEKDLRVVVLRAHPRLLPHHSVVEFPFAVRIGQHEMLKSFPGCDLRQFFGRKSADRPTLAVCLVSVLCHVVPSSSAIVG